jgi:hypothetical protein
VLTRGGKEVSTLLDELSSPAPVQHKRRVRTRTWALLVIGVLVVLFAGFAARYQPLTAYGSWAMTTPGPIGPTKITYDAPDIKNHELFGVTVVAINGVQVGQYPPPSKVSATQVCPITKKWGSLCENDNPRGILVGLPFHPFALSGGRADEVLWHFSYDCRGADSAVTVNVPVTYRFLIFTRTVVLSVPADESTC